MRQFHRPLVIFRQPLRGLIRHIRTGAAKLAAQAFLRGGPDHVAVLIHQAHGRIGLMPAFHRVADSLSPAPMRVLLVARSSLHVPSLSAVSSSVWDVLSLLCTFRPSIEECVSLKTRSSPDPRKMASAFSWFSVIAKSFELCRASTRPCGWTRNRFSSIPKGTGGRESRTF
jgi:hypothetical protein